MKKISFNMQLKISLFIVFVCFAMSWITKNELFINLALCLYGLIYFINPVVPKNQEGHPRLKIYVRITGFIIFFFRLLSKFRF